ncbi:MAG: DNA polymerase III subunit beta [Chloroflexota bacterium]|nr:MAG: DNA polymerase III subunit beta [Chloroflexota bacterium]
MKVSCMQENLSRGLGVVSRAVATKTTLPITNNVLLSTDQSRLKLAATNLEIAISCWVGAKVEEEGSITIPARLFSDFVGSLPNDRIDLSMAARSHSVSIKCARFDARMNGMDPEDFPVIPTADGNCTTRIDPVVLRSAIDQVVFAAATDEMRPVLAGVCVRLAGDEMTLAGADGFRLAVRKAALLKPVEEETELIIPAKALSELNRISGDEKEPIEITVSSNRSQVLFRLSHVELVTQLIQGTYPNYAQLIPQSYSNRVVVNSKSFREATKTASIFARDTSGIVRLQTQPGSDLTPGRLLVSARAEELGENTGELDAIVEGDAKIAFNAKYLADVLGVLDAGEVELQTNTPSSPGTIKPAGSDNYLHVIMPIFVQW